MEILFCLMVAWLFVKDTAVDGWAMAKGQKPPRHTERMARRQHEHERRLAAMKHRSAERIAGVGGPTVGDAFAERIRKGPKAREDMHGPRAWWFDLSADTAQRLTEERRARQQRTANGEQEWQKAARGARDWYRRTGEQAGQRWQERNAPRDPHRVWVDAERADRPSTDQPDPGRPDTAPVDAEVVDEPAKPQRPTVPELEPSWPDWGAPAGPTAERIHPETENPPGTVLAVAERIPEPLGASPAESTNSSTNDGGDAMGVIGDLGQLLAADARREPLREAAVKDLERADPEKGAKARADLNAEYARRGLTPDGLPALKGETQRGAPVPGSAAIPRQGGCGGQAALNGETVDPESLGGFASGMQQVAAAMQASIESSIANLTSLGVSGGPIDDLVAMADAAAILAGRSQSTAAHAASHRDIQGVAQSDPTLGGEQYLGIGAGRR